MTFRHFLAPKMILFLVWNSAAARPPVLGVVVEANRVYLNASEVSVGATVYDGDQFTTETGGMLLLRGDALTLQLAEDSSVVVRGRTSEPLGTEAELTRGTLIFSAERANALEIAALSARISPVADARTVAQITIAGLRELRIYARRGSLRFSYREQTETIAEGDAFRVILDPPEDTPKNEKTVSAGKSRKAFLLIPIAAGVLGASAFAYEERHHRRPVESPDRP